MKQVDLGYPKDGPVTVRLYVKHAPVQSYTPDAAEQLGRLLIEMAEQARKENADGCL